MKDTAARAPASSLEVPIQSRTLRLIKDDITALDVEAFVLYTRPNLELGSGFGSAITRRGGPSIKKELDAVGGIAVTEAVITTGGGMKAGHIVHAAGPAFQEPDTEVKLRATIVNALKAVEARGLTQVALPAMGAGFYAIPLPVCVRVMVETLTRYLAGHTSLGEVIICANDGHEYRAFEAALASHVPAPSASHATVGATPALGAVHE
ncbi:MAG: macro domain-containing protein [Acidobacteriota bacterium]